MRAPWEPGALILELEPALFEVLSSALAAPGASAPFCTGEEDFDALNAAVGLMAVQPFLFASTVVLRFDPHRNVLAAARAYASLEGVRDAAPELRPRGWSGHRCSLDRRDLVPGVSQGLGRTAHRGAFSLNSTPSLSEMAWFDASRRIARSSRSDERCAYMGEASRCRWRSTDIVVEGRLSIALRCGFRRAETHRTRSVARSSGKTAQHWPSNGLQNRRCVARRADSALNVILATNLPMTPRPPMIASGYM